MFCRKCGNEVSDNAKFCNKCGSSIQGITEQTAENEDKINSQTNSVDNNQIMYSLKPTFNYGYKIFTTLWKLMLYIVFVVVYFIAEFGALAKEVWLTSNFSLVLIGISIIVLIGIIIKLIFEKKQYDNLEYNLYRNRLEYIDSFINKEEKILKYKNIREVTMSQSLLERMFSIGTIKIYTNASGGYSSNNHGEMNTKNGIVIHCVTNVREEYEKIKQIIDLNNQ